MRIPSLIHLVDVPCLGDVKKTAKVGSHIVWVHLRDVVFDFWLSLEDLVVCSLMSYRYRYHLSFSCRRWVVLLWNSIH